MSRRGSESVLVKCRDTTQRLRMDDILYVELYNRALRYHTADGRLVDSLSLRESFQSAVAELTEQPRFVMCGASFLVNLDHVEAVRRDGAVLKNGEALQLPKQACTNLKAAWLNYWLEEDTP